MNRLAAVAVGCLAVSLSTGCDSATGGPSGFQKRVTGTCPTGSAVKAIDADGNVTCQTLPASTGLSDVAAGSGSGLRATVTGSSAAIALASCGNNEVLVSDGTDWSCAPMAGTTVSAQAPLAVSGGQVSLNSCPSGQVLKSDGNSWSCGTVVTSAQGPLSASGGQVSLSSCPSGQVLKSSGSSWACADDDQGISGSGASGRLAYWGSSSSVSSSSDLTWSNTNKRLSVAGAVETDVLLQTYNSVSNGTPVVSESNYKVSSRRYVVEAGPGAVGVTVPLDTAVVDELCRDKDGCKVSLMMVNYDGNGAIAPMTEQLFISETAERSWRMSNFGALYGTPVSGVDGSNTGIQSYQAWDCYLVDAELYTGVPNGHSDVTPGFGLLNYQGCGNWSPCSSATDSFLTCRVVFED